MASSGGQNAEATSKNSAVVKMAAGAAGEFTVKLKHGESVQRVAVLPNQTVAQLKAVVSGEHLCRLIYAGRELQSNQRLVDCGLREGAVVHVVMRPTRLAPAQQRTTQQAGPVDGCTMFTFLFTVLLLLLWMIAVSIPEYFSNFSWLMLGALSVVDVSVMFSQFKSWRAAQDPSRLHMD